MHSPSDPMGAGLDHQAVIELENLDSNSANSCLRDDMSPWVVPLEVFVPALRSWIEQRCHFTRFRIDAFHAIALEGIASRTRHPQILSHGFTIKRLGPNMLDLISDSGDSFRTQAVTAEWTSIGSNLSAKSNRYVFGHAASSSFRLTGLSRHFNNAPA